VDTRTAPSSIPTRDDFAVSGDRRRFLISGMYSLLAAIASAFGITSALYLFRTPNRQKQITWVDAGNVSDLQAGVPKQVTFERNTVDGWKVERKKDSAWIINTAEGRLTAFAPLCTHLGCAYQWEPKQHQFLCPCHGSVFSKTGAVVAGPAPRPLDQYQVKREGQRIWLGPVLKSGPAENEESRS
jgi:quinol---cytochrome c reductase iron-sulfur subunit, bacillus type